MYYIKTLQKIKMNKVIIKRSRINAASTALIDLRPVYEDCMRQKTLMDELVKLYELNIKEFVELGAKYLKERDTEALQLAAHKIKAGLLMMRTYSLHKIILQIESVCKKEKSFVKLNGLFKQFLKQYPIILKAIHKQVPTLE